MANKVRDHLMRITTIVYTHSAATVKDTIYLLNGLAMLAQNSEDANVANVFTIAGLIEYAKLSTQVWTAGEDVYWDDGNSRFTTVASGNTRCGITAAAAANPTATGLVILIPQLAVGTIFGVVYAGEHTTAGGAAAEDITITGALATDLAIAELHTVGAAPQTILTRLCAADKMTVTFSADPSTDHVVTYMVLRAI